MANMKTIKSNYDNKAVIDHLKSSFSIMESGGDNTTFRDSQSFLEFEIFVMLSENKYIVSLTEKGLNDLDLVRWNPKSTFTNFNSRTEAIKHILKALKIIK